DLLPYLTETWSVDKHGRQSMPFDGLRLGSRVMAAKDAQTSSSVRQLIMQTAGVTDSEWERTFDRPTGGILTAMSEMGQLIHQVATRGVRLCAKLD
ncbi:hypothetical protein CONLIGDRAFT_547874, partial [Coniochaeta ligniaria NRRL 30616]